MFLLFFYNNRLMVSFVFLLEFKERQSFCTICLIDLFISGRVHRFLSIYVTHPQLSYTICFVFLFCFVYFVILYTIMFSTYLHLKLKTSTSHHIYSIFCIIFSVSRSNKNSYYPFLHRFVFCVFFF